MSDTIVAIATSLASSAGVNIVRISGEKAKAIADGMFVSRKIVNGEMTPNFMYLGKINGEFFSEKAFCVFYRAPYSYTGEDVIEFHCHGGIGVTRAVVGLARSLGARPAEAGEFTKRAFLNGKLSLAEAEGVLDMINATSESAMRNAYRLMEGELTKGIEESEKLLTETAAMLEAKLDYPEELEEDVYLPAKENIVKAAASAKKLLSTSARAKTVTDGINIAIVGIPNAGKSSLLNALLGYDRAIVSDIAGTTRDVLKESMESGGMKLVFLDTAGIRDGRDEIEKLGIERSVKAIKSADIIIDVLDTTKEVTDEEKKTDALCEGKKVVRAANKSDTGKFPRDGIKVCARTGEGVGDVLDEVLKLADRDAIYAEGVITDERHIYALEEAVRCLGDAEKNYGAVPTECILVDIRDALGALGRITGSNVTEDIIDEVFSRFCVGK
jgi:tRNA modification GTPase